MHCFFEKVTVEPALDVGALSLVWARRSLALPCPLRSGKRNVELEAPKSLAIALPDALVSHLNV